MNPADVAAYANQAGFRGDALVTIVAIAGRESGFNENAVGDVAIEDATWGPSVGLYQIRTLKAATNTGGDRDVNALLPGGHGDPRRQSIAAWAISGNGTNFTPWSTYKGLSAAQLQAARDAINQAGSIHALPNEPNGGNTPQNAGGGGSLESDLTGLVDQALGQVVGADTFSGWLLEHAVRTIEVAGGALVLAVAGILFLDLMGSPAGAAGTGTGLVARTTRKAVDIAALAAL